MPAPIAYPDDAFFQNPDLIVAVMRLKPGGALPEFEECRSHEKVICLHAPFWLRGEVTTPVYGTPRTRHMAVVSAGHYGTMIYEDQEDPWLVVLLDDGKNVVMPTYASEPLVRRDDGALFLIADYEGAPSFLPCPIAELREVIDPKRFPQDLRLPADDYSVKTSPQFYSVTRNSAFPRYGIAVSRIAAKLATLRPTPKDVPCPDDSSG